jgi:hypothetical protein
LTGSNRAAPASLVVSPPPPPQPAAKGTATAIAASAIASFGLDSIVFDAS